MIIVKFIKFFLCAAALLLAACEYLPREYPSWLSWLPWVEHDEDTRTVPQEVQNLPHHYGRADADEILGSPEFTEVSLTAEPRTPTLPTLPALPGFDDESADADANDNEVPAREVVANGAADGAVTELTEADTVAGYRPRWATAETFAPSESRLPLRVFVLENIVGNFGNRDDLNIGLRVELFYRESEVGEEINFKRRALSLFASNFLGRYEFGNVTVQRIERDLLTGFNNLLEKGNLDSVAIEMNIRL